MRVRLAISICESSSNDLISSNQWVNYITIGLIIQMKYSIACDEDISVSPVTLKSNFSRTFTHFQSTTALEVTGQGRLRLKYLINEYGVEIEENKSMKNMEIEVQIKEEMQWQQVRLVWAGEEQWILFFENPFRIVFVLKKYGKMVPVRFDQPLQLTQVSCMVNYPDVILYGHKESTFTNHIYSINLTTFEARELTASKNYWPGNRKDYWAYFSDNRFYIYGGVDKQGKPVEELFWTYNIENGNWFALDMPSNGLVLPSNAYNCEIESGKVLVLSEHNLLLVELYQSRVNEVEGWKEWAEEKVKSPLKGYFIFKGEIYFHYQGNLTPFKGKILKTKKQK